MITHALKKEIEHSINEIQPHLCKWSWNFNKRMRMCQQSHEGHTMYEYAIPYITLYCIFYESIKNLQFLTINLCFLSKLLLA